MDSEFPPKIIVVGMNEYDEPQFFSAPIFATTTTTILVSVPPTSTSGPITVTIEGLHSLGASSVYFGSVAAEFTVVSDSLINTIVPS